MKVVPKNLSVQHPKLEEEKKKPHGHAAFGVNILLINDYIFTKWSYRKFRKLVHIQY